MILVIQPARGARARRACALRALGLLLADGAPTVHNVYFVKCDVTISFMAQVFDFKIGLSLFGCAEKYTLQTAHCALWGHRLPVTALAQALIVILFIKSLS